MQVFKSPKESLGDLGAMSAANLIAAATDVAVIVDGHGFIRDVAFNKEELSLELDAQGRWMGSKLSEIVTSETRGKIGELLHEAAIRKASNWRQVNHPSAGGEDIPVLYSAINIGREDRFVVVGRDLRPLAAMQQRLINAQQSMERDYAKLRHAETRYRLLFQVSSEAVMIVDATSSVIVDANPAALALFDESAPQVLKSRFFGHFDTASAQQVQTLLGDVRATGRDGNVRAQLAKGSRACGVAASLFRQENASLFLVRLSSDATPPEAGELKATGIAAIFRGGPGRIGDHRVRWPYRQGEPGLYRNGAAWQRGAIARRIAGSLARPNGRRFRCRDGQPAPERCDQVLFNRATWRVWRDHRCRGLRDVADRR